MYKIAAVGDFDEIAYFKVIGAETFFPKTKKDARRIMERLFGEEYAIIFVGEEYAGAADDNTKSALPAVVVLPGEKKTGEKNLREYIKRATGSSVNM